MCLKLGKRKSCSGAFLNPTVHSFVRRNRCEVRPTVTIAEPFSLRKNSSQVQNMTFGRRQKVAEPHDLR